MVLYWKGGVVVNQVSLQSYIALYILSSLHENQERPYNVDSTASRPLCEVKQHLARLVLRWGTTLESRVLFFLLHLLVRVHIIEIISVASTFSFM
jgi:hypothetical protein